MFHERALLCVWPAYLKLIIHENKIPYLKSGALWMHQLTTSSTLKSTRFTNNHTAQQINIGASIPFNQIKDGIATVFTADKFRRIADG